MAITNEIRRQIIALSATHSLRDIEVLLDKQGDKISHTTIGKIINENRLEREGQTKQDVNDYIKPTIIADLKILEDMRDQVDGLRKRKDLKISEILMCIDKLNKIIETRLKFSGAESKNETTVVKFITNNSVDFSNDDYDE